MTDTITVAAARTRGFVALLLLTAGALVLAGWAWPRVGDAVAVVLGIELLVWARLARGDAGCARSTEASRGLLITGGILTGVGSGVLLAAGPLLGAAPNTIGGAFLLGVAAGFVLVAVLSRLWRLGPQTWAWIVALVVGAVGAGLLGGPDGVANLITWGVPAGLLIGGAVATVRWLRA